MWSYSIYFSNLYGFYNFTRHLNCEISYIHCHMQEQQQKQLELILAIAKNGKLLDNKQAHDQPESAIRIRDSSTDNSKQKEAHQR